MKLRIRKNLYTDAYIVERKILGLFWFPISEPTYNYTLAKDVVDEIMDAHKKGGQEIVYEREV